MTSEREEGVALTLLRSESRYAQQTLTHQLACRHREARGPSLTLRAHFGRPARHSQVMPRTIPNEYSCE